MWLEKNKYPRTRINGKKEEMNNGKT